MILDTSALISILTGEPDAVALAQVLDQPATVRLSAASYIEAFIVLQKRRDSVLAVKLDDLIEDAKITIEPVTEVQARFATQAYQSYGKGSGHPANLNFGDCFSYALAREKREPILFKGDDFNHTDLRSALDAR